MTSIRTLRNVLTLFATFLPALASGQEPAALTEVLDVRVTNVDFVVSDLQGRFISGLTRADFEVLEDGKPQEITNFYEVRLRGGESASPPQVPGSPGSAAPSSRTARRLVLYFDNHTLSPFNRNKVIGASREFITKQLRQGDQVMIVTWSGKMDVRQTWTSDRAAIEATLDRISREGAQASAREAERKLVQQQIDSMVMDEEIANNSDKSTQYTFDMLMASARRYAEGVRADLMKASDAMAQLLGSLSGVEGRKILILSSEALPAQPGSEIFQHLESVRQQAMRRPQSSIGQSARTIQPLAEMQKFDMGRVITAIGRTANSSGVTIYALNPRPPDAGGNNEGTADRTGPADMSVEFAKNTQGIDGLQLLANETGGLAMIGAPSDVAFAKIDEDLGSYYSLGYRTRPGTSAERNIEVRAKRSGLRVRSRKSLFYRSAEAEMADRVIANQLQPSVVNDLGISLAADPLRNDGGKTMLPLKVLVPIANLTLLPSGETEIVGGFSVFVCMGDGKGDVSGVNVQSHQIRWPKEVLGQISGKSMTFAIDVPIEGERKQISVGVIDHVSQVSGFSKTLVGG